MLRFLRFRSFKTPTSLDRHLPHQQTQKKPWDVEGISKDDFFRRKYANISEGHRKRLDEKVARQRRLRQMKKEHEQLKQESDVFTPLTLITRSLLAEYVYGTHAVVSALEANKRGGFSRLYTHNLKNDDITRWCKKFGVKIVESTKQALNRLSDGGVHNGVVLETKRLELPELHQLTKLPLGQVHLSTYTSFGTQESTKDVVRGNAYPLGLYLDGITDPHNAGAIVRTAYFLGVDFVVAPEYDTAKLGPVAAKALAGALDLMPMYRVLNPLHFITQAAANGWMVVGTDARPTEDFEADSKKHHTEQLRNKYVETSALASLLAETPMLLVMGSEGTGMRTNMKLKADVLVGVDGVRRGSVDSLNVSVAAGVLIAAATAQ